MSHLAFHLRQVYPQGMDSQGQSALAAVSSLRFSSRIVGNAGAPIHSILSESREDINAESSNVWYSNDPMSAMIISRQGGTVNVGDQEDSQQDEIKGLLLHEEEHIQQEGE